MSVESAQLIADAIAQLVGSPIIKILDVVADGAIIATALFVLYQLRHSVLVREVRKVRAHERIAQWNEPHFVQRREGIYRYLADNNITHREKVYRYDNEHDFRAVVTQILNFFEALGQGIKDEVVDEESAKAFFSGIVVQFHNAALPVIQHVRGDQVGDILGDFGWLARRWT